ncbi:MAG: peptidase T [Candidatus Riflebacteria bacterium]|nr:peptidase T [Candidatus Riflebacteria bacterium]
MAERVLGRFLRYAAIPTQSKDQAGKVPSTDSQWTLARLLVEELKTVGLKDARVDSKCCVYATLPSNLPPGKAEKIPTIGLISHLDTSPDVPEGPIKPVIHRKYAGGDLALSNDRSRVLTVAENPLLKKQIGADIVTTDGTTLLGADDKAGIAEIVTALEELVANPGILHGTIKIAFTPDEEVGGSVDAFDVKGWGARYAYTVDGEQLGELSDQTFNASAGTVTFLGKNVHPGDAKGKMVNSLYAACRFVGELPRSIRPERVDGFEGYIHANAITGSEEKTTVKLLLRDFQRSGIQRKTALLERLLKRIQREFPGTKATLTVTESYRNMHDVLKDVPFVTDFAAEAMRSAGVTPVFKPVRGGTDGSDITFKGVPTPNLFTGGHNPHSRFEWISSRDMEKAVLTLVNLVRIWAEKGAGR